MGVAAAAITAEIAAAPAITAEIAAATAITVIAAAVITPTGAFTTMTGGRDRISISLDIITGPPATPMSGGAMRTTAPTGRRTTRSSRTTGDAGSAFRRMARKVNRPQS